MTADRGVREARGALRVVLAAFAALLALRGAVLLDPPYWDALLGLFPQASWLARHGLDPLALLREQPGYVEGGAATYPFSAVPYAIALLQRGVEDLETRLALLHLVSFAAAALACGAVWRLVRPLGDGLAWLAAAAFLAQPTSQAMACQIGLEMALTAACAWAVVLLVERRWAGAFACALAALLIKPTGVVVAAVAVTVLAARQILPRAFGAAERRERGWILAHAALLGLFAAEWIVTQRLGRMPPGAGWFGGLTAFAGTRVWTLPGFALALLSLVLALPFWLRRCVARGRAPWNEFVPATFLALYVLLLLQWSNPLPRYFVVAYPMVAAALVGILAAIVRSRGAVGAAVGAAALSGLLGAHGRFHPDRPARYAAPGESAPLASNDGWLLERSMRYRDGLALDRRVAAAAEARAGVVFVAPWPLHQALLDPALGYVRRPVPTACAEVPVRWADPPPVELDRALRRAGGRHVVWILSPNDFCGAASTPRPGDEVLERFTSGAQRAFFVRRAAWE